MLIGPAVSRQENGAADEGVESCGDPTLTPRRELVTLESADHRGSTCESHRSLRRSRCLFTAVVAGTATVESVGSASAAVQESTALEDATGWQRR
jgi:hypothetical protein